MMIVAGYLKVDPNERSAYLRDCVDVVDQGRAAPGCLDFALSADLVDTGRINILERWETQAAVEEFRGSGVSADQATAILAASVAEYEIGEVRGL